MSKVPSTVTALTLLTPGFEEPPVIVTVPVARVSATAATLALHGGDSDVLIGRTAAVGCCVQKMNKLSKK
jgi:hypothetical protein